MDNHNQSRQRTLLLPIAILLALLLGDPPASSMLSEPHNPAEFSAAQLARTSSSAAGQATKETADSCALPQKLTHNEVAELLASIGRGLVTINAVSGSHSTMAGTGIVLSSDGLVLTNNHVVSQATALQVTDLGNRLEYSAVVVGSDPAHDIAVIRIQSASGLDTATLGDSDSVEIGDPVASIGNALGTGNLTVSTGPVTHLRRSIDVTGAGSIDGLIEARNHVLPGESGGPMVDTATGEVIGVTVAYQTTPGTGSPTGIGYAIPIDSALRVADRLMSHHPGLTASRSDPASTRTGGRCSLS